MAENNVKDRILSDAIQTAIETEKKLIICKRVIAFLIGVIIVLVIV